MTRDTVMTMAVALALVAAKDDWAKLPGFVDTAMHELGTRYPDAGYGERFGMWIFLDGHEPYNSFGNGSAMRVSPVAYAAKDIPEVKYLSRLVTGITHNHPEGLKSAEATAVCTWMALHGHSKQDIYDLVPSQYYSMGFTLDEIRPANSFNETCQGTVPQAITAFLESTDFEDAIKNAISIGGDSDTLACITGGIAGAFYGVPSAIREMVLNFLDERLALIVDRFEKTFMP